MANFSTANGGVVFTIPADSHWAGHIILSATLTVAIGGAAATAMPSVDVSGTGGSWDDGHRVAGLALSAPAVGLTSLLGISVPGTVNTGQVFIQAGANPINLVLTVPAGTTAMAIACGELF